MMFGQGSSSSPAVGICCFVHQTMVVDSGDMPGVVEPEVLPMNLGCATQLPQKHQEMM